MGILAAGLAVTCVLGYQRFSPNRSFVRVGDKTFTRSDYTGAMEYYYGKQILNKMVYEELILQAAKKAGVTATDKEIDERIKQIERTNPKQLEAAQTDVAKMNEKKSDLKIAISLENLQIKDIKLTDAEAAAFYNKNKQMFGLPVQIQAQIVMTDTAMQAQNAKTMLEQNLKPDVIAQKRGLRVVGIAGFSPNWASLGRDFQAKLSQMVQTTPVNKAGIISVPNGKEVIYIIAKPVRASQAEVPPLASIKDMVVRTAKLVKAMQKVPPAAVLKDLYDKANVTFENAKYEAYFYEIKNMKVEPTDPKAAAKP